MEVEEVASVASCCLPACLLLVVLLLLLLLLAWMMLVMVMLLTMVPAIIVSIHVMYRNHALPARTRPRCDAKNETAHTQMGNISIIYR